MAQSPSLRCCWPLDFVVHCLSFPPGLRHLSLSHPSCRLFRKNNARTKAVRGRTLSRDMSAAAPASALPTMVTMPEHLSDVARGRIHQFMTEAAPMLPRSSTYSNMAQSEPEIFAQKWLLARLWVVADAIAMLSEAISYRCDRRLDTAPNFPSAFPIRGYDQSVLASFQGVGVRKEGTLDIQCKNISRCLCQVTAAIAVVAFIMTLFQ